MNRRGFLSLLSAGAAGFALDPERLLWRPGAKSYFFVSEPFKQQIWFSAGDVVCMPMGETRWGLATPELIEQGARIGVYDGTRVATSGVVTMKMDIGRDKLFFTESMVWTYGPPAFEKQSKEIKEING